MNLDKLSKKKMTQMKLEIKVQLENKELLKLKTIKNHRTSVNTFARRTSPSTDQCLQKSFHLSRPDKIELKKISTPSENKKNATAQPIDKQKPLPGKRFNYSVDGRPTSHNTYPKSGVSFSKNSFVVKPLSSFSCNL